MEFQICYISFHMLVNWILQSIWYITKAYYFIYWFDSFQEQIFRDPNGGMGKRNAWFSNDINIDVPERNLVVNEYTARAVDERLFEQVEAGGRTALFEIVLDALEQDDYCQFEVWLFELVQRVPFQAFSLNMVF